MIYSSPLSFIIFMPFIMIVFDMATSISFCQYYRKKKKNGSTTNDVTLKIVKVKKRIFWKKAFPQKASREDDIFHYFMEDLFRYLPLMIMGANRWEKKHLITHYVWNSAWTKKQLFYSVSRMDAFRVKGKPAVEFTIPLGIKERNYFKCYLYL